MSRPIFSVIATGRGETDTKAIEETFNNWEIAKKVFEENEFDIVINRHEAFNLNEVKRILKNGGYFITQQVGWRNNNDLSEKLIENFIPQFKGHDLKHNLEELKKIGFDVLFSSEEFPKIKFFDVGAIVYFAKIIEWEFPRFSVNSSFKQLCKLQNELELNKYVESTEHRFIIVAKKSS